MESVQAESGLTPYEVLRAKRIKENLLLMESLGIHESAQELKEISSKTKNQPVSKRSFRKSEPPLIRRTSRRLSGKSTVQYIELPEVEKSVRKSGNKKKKSFEYSVKREEVYTEEHKALLGDHKHPWKLFVDGYGADGKRIYDPISGKTCHQCRQKTMGHRTSCSECEIVQGQFCGDCLFIRYGENVLEANANPNWRCPPCRGICNCSICRVKYGWAPTGQLWHKVDQLGFKSVAHYLILTKQKVDSTDVTEGSQSEDNDVEIIEMMPPSPAREISLVEEEKGLGRGIQEVEVQEDENVEVDEKQNIHKEESTVIEEAAKDLKAPLRRSQRIQSVISPKKEPEIKTVLKNSAINKKGKTTKGTPTKFKKLGVKETLKDGFLKESKKGLGQSSKNKKRSRETQPDDGLFEIDRIVKWRKRGGKREALVKWLGFSDNHNSWEPVENLNLQVK